jgi:hypothetical protein
MGFRRMLANGTRSPLSSFPRSRRFARRPPDRKRPNDADFSFYFPVKQRSRESLFIFGQ